MANNRLPKEEKYAMLKNLRSSLPESLSEEEFTPILSANSIRIERILSNGQITPENEWYDQEENEWVLLIQGKARLFIENKGEVILNSGDHILLPAHVKHRVTWTDPDQITIWIAVFYKD